MKIVFPMPGPAYVLASPVAAIGWVMLWIVFRPV